MWEDDYIMNTLEDKINNNQTDEAIDIIDAVGTNKNKEYVPLLLKHLEVTTNGNLRNAIALALSDIGSTEMVEPIIRLLKDPKTLGNRGTLISALEPFDYSQYTDMFIEFLYTGNLEVCWKSSILIAAIAKDITEDAKQRYTKRLNMEIDTLDDKIRFMSDTIDLFDVNVNLSTLEECIENNDIDNAENIVDDIGRRKIAKAIPTLIKHLISTDNGSLRNKIALALSDIGCSTAIEHLIKMLSHPKTIGNRGTLLYALENLDNSVQIEVLVN